MTVSSELITHEKFKLDRRRYKLYRNGFQYRVSFDLVGAGTFDRCHTETDVANRLRLLHSNIRSQVDRTNITRWISWHRTQPRDPYAVTWTYWGIDLYTNSLALVQDLTDNYLVPCQLLADTRFVRVEARNNVDRDAIYHVRPRHQYRAYFTGHSVDHSTISELSRFVRQNDLRVNPHLAWSMWACTSSPQTRYYVRNSDFIDYNDPQFDVVLALMFPGQIRKFYRILPQSILDEATPAQLA